MASYLQLGEEYIIKNVVSRPELNGQICSVENMSFGGGKTTLYNAQLQCTGELVRLAADKLSPLSEAPDHVLYDGEDLQRDEYPLASESMLLINLRNRSRCARDSSFTVRIHGLQSASGQLRNGQQGVAFRDNGNGRLGVRCADGEEISLKLANLLLTPVAVALPADCLTYMGAVPCNAASRGAGDFCASEAPQPGFFVHRPPSLPEMALNWEGAGWPGVYTDRRLAGVAKALPSQVTECWRGSALGLELGLESTRPNRDPTRHKFTKLSDQVVECGSWTEAWETWGKDELEGCPYVMPLRTPVAADVTAAELFDCFRWCLMATRFGQEASSADGVALVGAHVEPPSALAADVGPTPHFGFVVLSLSSLDARHYVDDLLYNWVEKATFRLSIRGQPLSFQCSASCKVGESGDGLLGPAPFAPPPKKRVSDDWMNLVVCPNAPFAFSKWSHRHHATSVMDHFSFEGFSSASAELVE